MQTEQPKGPTSHYAASNESVIGGETRPTHETLVPPDSGMSTRSTPGVACDRAKEFLPTILVVDDERGPRIALEWLLGHQNVCRVIQCDTPESAMTALTSNPLIEVVVMDRRMPQMSGDVLAMKLKGIRPGLRIILHTAMDEENEDLESSLFFAKLRKPACANGLVARVVDAVLRGEKPEGSGVARKFESAAPFAVAGVAGPGVRLSSRLSPDIMLSVIDS